MTYDEYARFYQDAQDLRWNYGKFNSFKQELSEFLASTDIPEHLSKNLSESYCLIAEYCEKLKSDIKEAEAKAIKRNYAEETYVSKVEVSYEQDYSPRDDTPFVPIDCVFNTPYMEPDWVSLGMGF